VTGIVYFAIGGVLLVVAYFWLVSLFPNESPTLLLAYGLAFISLLLTGAGLHGILKSATH